MAIKQEDAISAREGTVFVTLDGRTFEMGEIKTLEASVSLVVADVEAIGQRMLGGKIVGGEGEGSITYHFQQGAIRKMVVDFIKTGRYPEITLKIANADVTSRAGRQTVLLKGVLFTSTKIAELDGTSDDVLEDETDFRFNDVDFLETFKEVI